MMTNRFKLAALVVSLALTSLACDEKLSDVAGPTPNLEPTLSSIQASIFSASDSSSRLACVQCHTNVGRTPAAGINLIAGQSYASLVGRNSTAKAGAVLVVPGDPDNSYLLDKLNGASSIVGLRMPRNNGPFLTAGQISIIRRWIQLGAKND
jgi:hypothetical protein